MKESDFNKDKAHIIEELGELSTLCRSVEILIKGVHSNTTFLEYEKIAKVIAEVRDKANLLA